MSTSYRTETISLANGQLTSNYEDTLLLYYSLRMLFFKKNTNMKHVYICCLIAVLLVASVVTSPVYINDNEENGTPLKKGTNLREKREVHGKRF